MKPAVDAHPARRVLVIHPDARRRDALRAALAGADITVAADRAEVTPRLEALAPAVVIAHAHDFRKLLRDLERSAPGALRAALLPPGDETARRTLVSLAAEGFDFVTLDEDDAEGLRALVSPRASVRFTPSRPLRFTFTLGDDAFHGRVVDLGCDGAGVELPHSEAANALAPGVELHQPSLSDDDGARVSPPRAVVRTLRRGAAGPAAMHVGVAFESPPWLEPAEVLADPVWIPGLLHRALGRSELCTLTRPTRRRGAPFEVVTLLDDRVTLRPFEGPQPFAVGEALRLDFEFNGISYDGLCGVVAADALLLTVGIPASLRRRQRRRSLRARCGPGFTASVTVRNPLDGSVTRRPLLDLQPDGFAFEVDTATEAFPPGLRLDQVTLHLAGDTLLCRATVHNVARGWRSDAPSIRRCGLALDGLSPEDRERLVDALAAARVPEIEDGRARPFAEVWRMFREEGAGFPDWPIDDPDTEARLTGIQERVAGLPGRLHRAFIYRAPNGEPQGFSAGLRIYSGTWLSQHLLVRSGYSRGVHASQSLVQMTFDYAEALDDVEYMRGLWRLKNRWAARVYGAATEKLVYPGRSYLARFDELRLSAAAELPPSPLEAHEATADDEAALLAHLRTVWDPVRLKADDLIEGQLHLEAIGEAWRRHGFHRARRLAAVDGPHGPRGWVLVEEMSRGLFWGETCDSFALHLVEPLAPDADDVRLALLAAAQRLARARGLAHLECHAAPEDAPLLERLGFRGPGAIMEFCAHHSMVREMTTQMLLIFQRVEGRARARQSATDEVIA